VVGGELLFGVFPLSWYRASARAHALQPLGPREGPPRPGGPKIAVNCLMDNPYKMDVENSYRKSSIKF
jgi:hypothetical protein